MGLRIDKIIPHTEIKDPFYVKCAVCNGIFENWVGSTPCCGSIAYLCDSQGKDIEGDEHSIVLITNFTK